MSSTAYNKTVPTIKLVILYWSTAKSEYLVWDLERLQLSLNLNHMPHMRLLPSRDRFFSLVPWYIVLISPDNSLSKSLWIWWSVCNCYLRNGDLVCVERIVFCLMGSSSGFTFGTLYKVKGDWALWWEVSEIQFFCRNSPNRYSVIDYRASWSISRNLCG